MIISTASETINYSHLKFGTSAKDDSLITFSVLSGFHGLLKDSAFLEFGNLFVLENHLLITFLIV